MNSILNFNFLKIFHKIQKYQRIFAFHVILNISFILKGKYSCFGNRLEFFGNNVLQKTI